MKWEIDYNTLKIIHLTDLANKTIKIWKNVKINSFWNPSLWKWIEIGDYTIFNWLNWLNWLYYDENYQIIIGKFCSIAVWATFIAKMHHNYNNLSTYVNWDFRDCPKKTWWTIIVWNDVRIWRYAIILKWVHIWTWAVIWAWAVVTKDVPPYAIVWWNPAKIIKYRFDNVTIKKLLESERWNRNIEKIKENYNLEFLNNN